MNHQGYGAAGGGYAHLHDGICTTLLTTDSVYPHGKKTLWFVVCRRVVFGAA